MSGTPAIGLICIATILSGGDRSADAYTAGAGEEPVCRPDAPDPEGGAEPDESCRSGVHGLVSSLLDWIGDHTDYDVGEFRVVPPDVSFVAPGETVECDGEEVLVDEDLHALYDPLTRRVRIVLPWNIGDTFDRSVLLHEIVHDVQLNSRHWYCPEESEWEAYELQAEWLSEQGVEPEFDWLHIYFLSRCPRDFHP